MKKLSLILLVYLGLIGNVFADHSSVGLDKLKATNDCEFCHLKGTDLSGQTLLEQTLKLQSSMEQTLVERYCVIQ